MIHNSFVKQKLINRNFSLSHRTLYFHSLIIFSRFHLFVFILLKRSLFLAITHNTHYLEFLVNCNPKYNKIKYAPFWNKYLICLPDVDDIFLQNLTIIENIFYLYEASWQLQKWMFHLKISFQIRFLLRLEIAMA